MDLRFRQWFCWRFKSSRRWCSDWAWSPKKSTAASLRLKAPRSFKTWDTTYLVTDHHILEEMNVHDFYCCLIPMP